MNVLAPTLPTVREGHLLRAAFHPPAQAEIAWERWLGGGALREHDQPSVDLLPLVHANLKDRDIRDSGIVRGVHRQAWYRHQLRVRSVRPLLAAMRAEQLDVMLLKGAAMASHYADDGLRPMHDVDVLVREGDAARALQIVRDHGWALKRERRLLRDGLDPGALRYLHGVGVTDGASNELDLHWHASDVTRWRGSDRSLWYTASSSVLDGVEVVVPGPEELVVQAILRGVNGASRSLRWIADAVMVVRAGLDADRVLALAEDWAVGPLVHHGLHHLDAEELVEVDAALLAGLPRTFSDRVDRAYFGRRAGAPFGRVDRFLAAWGRYRRGVAPTERPPAHLLAYLRHHFDEPSLWSLVGQLGRHALGPGH